MGKVNLDTSTSVQSDFPSGLRRARLATGTTQEAFDLVSSRTYVSALERGLKSPTVPKVDALAAVMKLHPLTLFVLSYLDAKRPSRTALSALMTAVHDEVVGVLEATDDGA